MKRLFPLLLLLFWLIGLMAVAPAGRGVSQAGTVVRVAPETVSLSPGETTTIEIRVDDVVDLRGFSVEAHFDPDYLSVSDLAHGDFLAHSGFYGPVNIDNDDGTIIFAFTIEGNDNVQSGSGVLFSFKLTAKDFPGEGQLEIVESDLVGLEHFPITHDFEHGSVRVIGVLDDHYEIVVNETLSVDPPGVLANDILPVDVDYVAELTADIPTYEGLLSLLSDGRFTYTPPLDWAGTTGFAYRACNNENCTGPATVTINVVTVQGLRHWVYLPLILRH